jgi:hypothetical protein
MWAESLWGGHSCPPLLILSLSDLTFQNLVIPIAPRYATPCHPEAPSFGAEGPMQSASGVNAADASMGPSACKKRGPQDDNAKSNRV